MKRNKVSAPLVKPSPFPFAWRMVALIVLLGLLVLIPPQNNYQLLSLIHTYSQPQVLAFPTPFPLPVALGSEAPPELSANGAIVVDIDTGISLIEKNADTPLPPASTTKILTALVALDLYKPGEVVTIKTVIPENYSMGLVSGEQITVESLMYGMLVNSANDAAYSLAEHYSGGVEGFMQKMNEKAAALYLTNSHFVNPIGFDDPQHYMSPRDLARLTRIAMHNPTINKITQTATITVSDINFTRFHNLRNVNQLLGKVPGVYGFKTGSTPLAGECLVTAVARNGHKIIVVVLGSKDRFGESETILSWVYRSFEWKDMKYSS